MLDTNQTLEDADVSRLEIRGSNVKVRNVKVDGMIVVIGDNVVVDRVLAQGLVVSSGSNVTVQYSEFAYGPGADATHVTSDRGRRVRNVVLRHNYLHSPRINNGNHYDGTQVRGVDGLVIECNFYDPGRYFPWMNSAVYLEDANGGNANVRVSNNWLYGYAFPMMVGPTRNLRIEDNRIGGDIKWGPCHKLNGYSSSATSVSGNTWDESGKPVNLCG